MVLLNRIIGIIRLGYMPSEIKIIEHCNFFNVEEIREGKIKVYHIFSYMDFILLYASKIIGIRTFQKHELAY